MNQTSFAMPDEERKAIQDLASSFAAKEVSGHTIAHEYPYPRSTAGLIRTALETGLFGINLPVEWDGTGLGVAALVGIMETLGATDAGIAAMLFTHAAALEIISAAAEDDGENCRSIYKLVSGPEGVPLAFQSFSAPDETELPQVTGAELPLLSGKIALVALGGMARYAVVAAAGEGENGFSYYLVDLSAHGVVKSAPIHILGMQAAQAVDIAFDRVPALRIGAENQGAIYFQRMQSRMSVPAAAISLGIMEGSFKEAIEYAKQRFQGGRNIIEWSGLRMKFAELAIQIDVARSCLSGISAGCGSAMAAALHIGNMACSVTSEGVQLLGGYGYMKDYGQEKRMRDANQARTLLGMSGLKKMNYIKQIIEGANV